MRRNPVKAALKAGQPQVGTWLSLGNVFAARLMARVGFNWLTVDLEHSPIGWDSAGQLFGAVADAGCTVLARVPRGDHDYIKRVLDAGAHGIVVPMVNTVEDARRLVSYCTFPPTGVRGIAPNLCRHTDYGVRREEYMSRVLPQITVMAQIETKEGLANIDGIAAVEGISLLFIGPFDLSADLGYPGQFDHPVVTAAIERIETAAKAANKALATLLLPGQDAAALRARGYRLIIAGSDVGLLRSAFSDQLKTFAKVKAMPVPV